MNVLNFICLHSQTLTQIESFDSVMQRMNADKEKRAAESAANRERLAEERAEYHRIQAAERAQHAEDSAKRELERNEFADTLRSMRPNHVESVQEDDESTKAAKIAKRAEDMVITQKKSAELLAAKHRLITSNLQQELVTLTAELNSAKRTEAEIVTEPRSRKNSSISTHNALVTKKCQLAVDNLTLLLSRPPWIHRLEEGNKQQWLCSDDLSQFPVAVGDIVR